MLLHGSAFLTRVYHCALQSLIKYISELGIPGAILIFLPGWNIIFALGRHLGQHPVIGDVWHYIVHLVHTCNLHIGVVVDIVCYAHL